MNKSNITWTETTWSPVIGCTKVSAGCKHCYAEREVETRWSKNPKSIWFGRSFGDVLCRPEVLAGASSPLKWKKPRRIFVCPRADLFHEAVPVEFIAQVFAVMAQCPQHTFQILTKRTARMQFVLWSELDWQPLPNVWIGTSIEDQATADERVPLLLQTPAAVRWLSAEPLLGPVDLSQWLFEDDPELCACGGTRAAVHTGHVTCLSCRESEPTTGTGIDWVVAGYESGPKEQIRQPDPAAARGLCDQCAAAGVPFLFKQWGPYAPLKRGDDWGSGDVVVFGGKRTGRLLDGVLHDSYPEVLR